MGVGRWGAWAPLDFENFSKKGCFLSFVVFLEWEKTNFTTLWLPWTKFWKNPLVAPPPGKNPSYAHGRTLKFLESSEILERLDSEILERLESEILERSQSEILEKSESEILERSESEILERSESDISPPTPQPLFKSIKLILLKKEFLCTCKMKEGIQLDSL